MSPVLSLIICGTFLAGLAFVLFGAPFLPFLRPYAFPILVILSVLGNSFIFFVAVVAVCIAWGGGGKETLSNSDCIQEEEEEEVDECSKKTS